MKLRNVLALIVVTAFLTETSHADAACPGYPKIAQAPVPDGVAPVASADQPYVWRKVNEHFYVVAEIHHPFPRDETTNPPHTQQMGLILGTKKAALIDTGLGLANLRAFVSQITCLPVIVLNTHGHLDHVGANQLFDMSYISKEDEATMHAANRQGRLRAYEMFTEGDNSLIESARKTMIPDGKFEYGFIKDGDQIDLGGVKIEVIGFPGHTPGSLAFVDRRDKVAFTGDSMLFRVLLDDRQKVREWLTSVERFAAMTRGIDTIINGHQWAPFRRSDIDEERALAHAILDGTIKGSKKKILGSDRTIYVLGTKRIGLLNDN